MTKFRIIFECPVCGYDVSHVIGRCPKCLAFCMQWVKVLTYEAAEILRRAG